MTRLTLELAERAARAAQEKARELGIATTVSIVDEAGRLILTMRGDNTGFLTTDTSRGKAIASAAFGMSTEKMVELQKTNPAFWTALPGFADDVLPTTGAVPMIVDDVLIGAIGCGGGSPSQDHACAEAGARALTVALVPCS